MAITLTTSGACLLKAGDGVNSKFKNSATTETDWEDFINKAEGTINVVSRYNWNDAYAALNDDVKLLLNDMASSLAASYAVNYDMIGYPSLADAQTKLDVLRDSYLRGLSIIKEQVNKDFVNGA